MKEPSLLQAQEAARRAGCVIGHRGSIHYWLARAAEAQAGATTEPIVKTIDQFRAEYEGQMSHVAEEIVSDMLDSEFTLQNDNPKPAAWRPPKEEPCRQSVLFAGLQCDSGQEDLFPTDGKEDHDEHDASVP